MLLQSMSESLILNRFVGAFANLSVNKKETLSHILNISMHYEPFSSLYLLFVFDFRSDSSHTLCNALELSKTFQRECKPT